MFRTITSSVMSLCTAVMLLGTPQSAHAALYTSQQALEDARLFALEPLFQSVGLFTATGASTGNSFIAGSGVLIDPYWVLTAGHVATTLPSGWESMEFNFAADVGANLDQFVAADLWMPFPGYDPSIGAGKGNDIGLVRLSSPIFDVAPAERFYGEDIEGTEMVMAGYGNPGVWPNEGTFDGIRRAGENIGDSFGFDFGLSQWEEQYWVADFDQASSQNPFPLEWNASKNDSGGGWFDAQTMQLAGIHSFSGGNSTLSGAIRVSLYNDWIDATMAANPPASVPEPGSLIIFSMGMLGLGASRFRKRQSC